MIDVEVIGVVVIEVEVGFLVEEKWVMVGDVIKEVV